MSPKGAQIAQIPEEFQIIGEVPAEVLLYIFDFATDDFDPRRQGPTIDVGDSPWSTTLRMKKAIVCVCKKWRTVAIPDLYRRVLLASHWSTLRARQNVEGVQRRWL